MHLFQHPRGAAFGALIALSCLALMAQPASAQDAGYVARMAYGDIPTTTTVEGDGSWNLEQITSLLFDNSTLPTVHLFAPTDSTVAEATCSYDGGACPEGVIITEAAAGASFLLTSDAPSGAYEVRLLTMNVGPVEAAFTYPQQGAPGSMHIHAERGVGVTTNLESDGFLPAGDGLPAIHSFDVPAGKQVAVAMYPAGGIASDSAPDFPWMHVVLAALIGAAVWALLVRQGLVQARTRRQTAGTAAHEEAKKETSEMLEARKRALMAALKDLEKAHRDGEVDTDVYDTLKAEMKADTVAIMRALE